MHNPQLQPKNNQRKGLWEDEQQRQMEQQAVLEVKRLEPYKVSSRPFLHYADPALTF